MHSIRIETLFEERYLTEEIIEDLEEKMVFIGGPRQVGKTTLCANLLKNRFKGSYFNYDKSSERVQAIKGEWPIESELIVLDEFHKYSKWKNWIKGEFDHHKTKYKFLLTGSARLNVYRRGGDSLMGRYHYYKLHPYSLGELTTRIPLIQPGEELVFKSRIEKEIFHSLYHFSGFPEPVYKQSDRFLRRWQNERIERVLREDIRDLTLIRDVDTLALLSDLLPSKVGSILSINSISRDLSINFRTAANYLDTFDYLYLTYRLAPFASKKIKSVKKEKKLYLWDWSVISNEGAKLENLVGSHLLKFCDYLYDADGWKVNLYYLRDETGREVDFLVTWNEKPWFAVEVKSQDSEISKHLNYFKDKLKIPFCYQVSKNSSKEFFKNGIHVMSVEKFISALN